MVDPYNPDTQKYRIFEVLSDLKWHCSEHELPGSQPAKALQMIRQDGYEMEKVGSNWGMRKFYPRCKRNTPHRRLVSTTSKNPTTLRSGIPAGLARRIRRFYQDRNAYPGYEPTGRTIEIDHRVPQIRWKSREKEYPKEIGCEGCGWAHPGKWRESINRKLGG